MLEGLDLLVGLLDALFGLVALLARVESILLQGFERGVVLFLDGLPQGFALALPFPCDRLLLLIEYRMPPKHPFPAAVEDVVAVWKSLLKKRDAKSMALGGTSAGGGLVLASTHKLIGLGIPVPGALFAGTPLISPVYGDFKGVPSTYLVSGTRDMFLSNTVRTHRKLRTADLVADLNVYEGFSHGEYLKVIDSPESQQVFAELGAFLLKYLK